MPGNERQIVLQPNVMFNAVKIFSATMLADRAQLGEKVTGWMADHAGKITEMVVTQSSDSEFHCLAITVFYRN